MKVRAFLLLWVFGVATIAFAQPDRSLERLQVNFQQPVVVNSNTTIPPGEYIFQRVAHDQQMLQMFDIRDTNGKQVTLTAVPVESMYSGTMRSRTVPPNDEVVLKRVGNKEYLQAIWYAGQPRGYSFHLAPKKAAANSNGNNANQSSYAAVARPAVDEIVIVAVPVGNGNQAQPQNSSGNTGTQSQPQH